MTKLERNKSIYECHKKGMTQEDIGDIFFLAQNTVSQIITAIKKEGLVDKPDNRGLQSKLTDSQKEQLKTFLLECPEDYGFFKWDKWSVKSLIKQKFEVDYHENYIWYIMKCINFSSQKPQTKDYRKDAKKVEVFKEKTAESIKKKLKMKIEK